jgi:hypothetical protein
MSIVFEYPSWFILFCLITGAAYAFLLYRKDRKFSETSQWITRTMSVLRFFTVSVLAFLLLSPLLKTQNREVEKPLIIIAQDNSQSLIMNKDSGFYRSEYKQKLQQLIDNLGDKYEVYSYSFADKVKELGTTDSLRFNEKQTDISALFTELETRYSNRNVGAVIVASDGLYNKGSNPVYTSSKLKVPVYTIALGDTTIKKDLILSRVDHNRIAYLGNKFPLEVIIDAKQLKGKTSTLTVSKGNQSLLSQVININSETFTTTVPVLLEAKETGLQHYKVKLSSLQEEVSTLNNCKDIFIDVLDARQKILVLADAPHPDVAALKDALMENQNYEVESYTFDDFDKPLQKYNLVILHQLPGARNSASKIISTLKASAIPVWAFSGAAALVKKDLSSLSVSPKSNECEPVLEENFPLFTISDIFRDAVKDFPAVICPFGGTAADNNSDVLFYQRIGVVDTKTPMMLFSSSGDIKLALFNGEGIWKWRLQDFAAHGNHDAFNELVTKTVQYLSVKVDKSFFRIIAQNNFLENEAIEMEAEVYNQSYELINEPEVSIVITNSENKKFPFTFGKTNNAYRLNAGMFPVGEYNFEAKVKVGEKIYTQKGEFSVSALQVEYTNTVADHQMLYSLAHKHDGEMIYPPDMEKLSDKLNARDDIKSVSYTEKRLNDLINLKWIFFIILILISTEWFMRKRNGAY